MNSGYDQWTSAYFYGLYLFSFSLELKIKIPDSLITKSKSIILKNALMKISIYKIIFMFWSMADVIQTLFYIVNF